jgi:hypothetical protein
VKEIEAVVEKKVIEKFKEGVLMDVFETAD